MNFFLSPQTLYADDDVLLCDCPGLVFPSFVSTKAEMVCSGILPIDQMRDHVGPVTLVSFTTSSDLVSMHVVVLHYSIGMSSGSKACFRGHLWTVTPKT